MGQAGREYLASPLRRMNFEDANNDDVQEIMINYSGVNVIATSMTNLLPQMSAQANFMMARISQEKWLMTSFLQKGNYTTNMVYIAELTTPTVQDPAAIGT